MSCTASRCRCGWCGTHGKGDVGAALVRAKARDEEAQRRIAEFAVKRDLAKLVKAPR